MSALRKISSSSATSVSNYNVTDIFSNDFNLYQVNITDFKQVATWDGGMRLINSSGSVVTSSEYTWARLSMRSYGTFIQDKDSNDTEIQYIVGSTTTSNFNSTGGCIWFFTPADNTQYTYIMFENTIWLQGSGIAGSKGVAVYRVLDKITGFQIFSTGTMDRISTSHYGYRVD